jgi:signal transduction histidine kinase
MEFSDGNQHLFAATVLRPSNGTGPRAIVLSVQDRSRGQALGDMVKALPLMVVVGAGVGLPLTLLLVRSVGGPLRRLADATADLPTGEAHRPLPLEGPGEIRELTARFNAMAEELETARAREAALLADLRHDLRTPLTVIAGYASALSDGTATGDDAVRAAQTIGEESARLERLVDELGAVERLRRGAEGLRPERIDARDLLTSSAQRFGAAAAAAGAELEVIGAQDPGTAGPDSAAPGLELVADRGALDRIMANLISNALAAAPGGHVWLSATAGPAANETVILAVTDDGPGFPPGAAARAFERFYRVDPARAGGGSGLGLAIVREFAAAHGGTAHAENVAPRGARVSVVLPRIPLAR